MAGLRLPHVTRRAALLLIALGVAGAAMWYGHKVWRDQQARKRLAEEWRADKAQAKELLGEAADIEDPDKKAEALEKALIAEPANKYLHLALSETLSWCYEAEVRETAQEAERLARISTGSGILWAAAAYHWADAKEPQEALRCARQATDLGYLGRSGGFCVAKALYADGDYEKALEWLEAAVTPEWASSAPEALWYVVRTGYMAGKPEFAVAMLEETDIEYHRFFYEDDYLVQAYVAAGQHAKAKQLADRFRSEDTLDEIGVISAAYAAYVSGEQLDTGELFCEFPDLASDEYAMLLFAAVACDKNNYDAALQVCVRRAIREIIAPPHTAVPFGDKFCDAPAVPTLEDLWCIAEDSAAKGGDDPDALMTVGCVQAMTGRDAEAHETFSRVVEMRPDSEPAQTYLKTGELEDWADWLANTRHYERYASKYKQWYHELGIDRAFEAMEEYNR